MPSLLSKARLLGSLLRGENTRQGPIFLNLDLVNRCNNACLGCYYHRSGAFEPGHGGDELPFDLAARLARELGDLGVSEVVMAGQGEPLLHTRFFDVMSALRQAGLRTQVFTNGILLDERMVRRIASSGISVLRASLWAITEAEHERWHPGIDVRMLDKRLAGIRALARACRDTAGAPEVCLQLPINRENLSMLDRRIDFAIESGATAVSFGYYRAFGSPLEYLALGPDDSPTVSAAFKPALARLKAAGIRHDAGGFLERVRLGLATLGVPCYAPWYACSIRVNGDVLVCPRCAEPMGNLHASSMADIWRGARFREFRRQAMRQTPAAGGCQNCECVNCCWVRDNIKVHRIFRRFAPATRWRAGRAPTR
jgi:radical SAM protein with 4Fe4S-binding SPASM domain